MRIAVCSMFRNSQEWYGHRIGQVDRYIGQIINQDYDPEKITVFALEGDSNDDTFLRLQHYQEKSLLNIHLFHQDNNHGAVASSGTKERVKELANIADYLLEQALVFDIDQILWVESDLIIKADLLTNLISQAEKNPNSVIAPMCYLDKRNIFYDTWGFRDLNGDNWKHGHREDEKTLKPMLSIGSCALIDANLLRQGVRFGNGAFVELCERTRNFGGNVYVDRSQTILHPGDAFIHQRWI